MGCEARLSVRGIADDLARNLSRVFSVAQGLLTVDKSHLDARRPLDPPGEAPRQVPDLLIG